MDSIRKKPDARKRGVLLIVGAVVVALVGIAITLVLVLGHKKAPAKKGGDSNSNSNSNSNGGKNNGSSSSGHKPSGKGPTGPGALLGSMVNFSLGSVAGDTPLGLQLGPNGLSVAAAAGDGSKWTWTPAPNPGSIKIEPVTDGTHKFVVAGSLAATTSKGATVYLSTDGKQLTVTKTAGASYVFFAATTDKDTTYAMGVASQGSTSVSGWVQEPSAKGPIALGTALKAFVSIAGTPPPHLPPASEPYAPNLSPSNPPGIPLSTFAMSVRNIKIVASGSNTPGSTKQTNKGMVVTASDSQVQVAQSSYQATGCWVWTPIEFDATWVLPADLPSNAKVQAGTLANLSFGKTRYLAPGSAIGKPLAMSGSPQTLLLVTTTSNTSSFAITFTAPSGKTSPGWVGLDGSSFVNVGSLNSANQCLLTSIGLNTDFHYRHSTSSVTPLGGRYASIANLTATGGPYAPAVVKSAVLRAVNSSGEIQASIDATVGTLTPNTKGSNGSSGQDSFFLDKMVVPTIDVAAATLGGYSPAYNTAFARLDATFSKPVTVGRPAVTITSGSTNAATFIFLAAKSATMGYLGVCQPASAFKPGAAAPPLGWLAYSSKTGFSLVDTPVGAQLMSIETPGPQVLNADSIGTISSYTAELSGTSGAGQGLTGSIPYGVLAANVVDTVIPRVQCKGVINPSDLDVDASPVFTVPAPLYHDYNFPFGSTMWKWTPLSKKAALDFLAPKTGNKLPPTPYLGVKWGVILGYLNWGRDYLTLVQDTASKKYGLRITYPTKTVVALYVPLSGGSVTNYKGKYPPSAYMQLGFPTQKGLPITTPAMVWNLSGGSGNYVPGIAPYNSEDASQWSGVGLGLNAAKTTLTWNVFWPGKAPGFVTDLKPDLATRRRPGRTVPFSSLASGLAPLELSA